MTHTTILGTQCRIISITGKLNLQVVSAITSTGVEFSVNIQQFEKDWKPIT